MSTYNRIAAVVPAAGHANRIQPLPCSKEIYPVGYIPNEITGTIEPKVVASDLLSHLSDAGVQETYIIIRPGKWDIPQYFASAAKYSRLNFAYIVTEPTPGTPFSIDQAYPYARNKTILFGFPDIIIKTDNPFKALLHKLDTTDSDLVLGLFETDQPWKADMVETGKHGRLLNIVIKPEKSDLTRTWLLAVWKPVFTDFMHNKVSGLKGSSPGGSNYKGNKEIFMGDIINEAVRKGLKVGTVYFPAAAFLDIGTKDDLKKLFRTDW